MYLYESRSPISLAGRSSSIESEQARNARGIFLTKIIEKVHHQFTYACIYDHAVLL